MKKKILSVVFSAVSGSALLLEAFGVNAGDPVIDGVISCLSGILMAAGIVTASAKKKDEK